MLEVVQMAFPCGKRQSNKCLRTIRAFLAILASAILARALMYVLTSYIYNVECALYKSNS
jgi:hypothetical protein